MRRATAVLLAGSALSLGADAVATTVGRFEVHLRVVPIVADPGKPIHVRFTVYSVTARRRVLSDHWQFRLVAVSPTAARVGVRLEHVSRGTWTGLVRLRRLGTWRIRVANWRGIGTGPIIKVKVRRPVPPTTTAPSP